MLLDEVPALLLFDLDYVKMVKLFFILTVKTKPEFIRNRASPHGFIRIDHNAPDRFHNGLKSTIFIFNDQVNLVFPGYFFIGTASQLNCSGFASIRMVPVRGGENHPL